MSLLAKIRKPFNISLTRNSNNFDAIRLFAAALVLIAHSSAILGHSSLPFDPFLSLFGIGMGEFGVYIFFIISGFLVAGSWEKKKNILDFILARVLRIYPAAIIVVLLSILVLGVLLTTNTLAEYFSSDLTFKYLQNATLFRGYYYLPGVFDSNPIGGSINGSLWTLPYEVMSYIFLGLFGAASILKTKVRVGSLLGLLIILDLLFHQEIEQMVIPILGIDFKTFYPLFLYFLSGTVYYLLRNQINFNGMFATLMVLMLVILKDNMASMYASALLLPYIILTIAFSKIPFNNVGKYGDYSYGIYLYAFPVQQLIVYFLPNTLSLAMMIFLSFLLTFPFAFLSWKLVESPSLKLRKIIFG